MDYIRISEKDNVAVALTDLKKGYEFSIDNEKVILSDDIMKGHKIAIKDLKANDEIIKYGLPIGHATCDIKKGEHVHIENIKTNLSDECNYSYKPSFAELKKHEEKYFDGYKRPNGKVGIRNEIWIIPTVGCVNSISKNIEEYFKNKNIEGIDGVYAFTHPYGCSQLGDDHENTKKLLASLVNHPNAAAVLVLGLGCENLTISQFKEAIGNYDEERVKFLIAQDVEDEFESAIEIVNKLIDYAKKFKREKINANELIIGMKCGGSDGLSGITANPVVGNLSDKLISLGGTTILTEVPEMFGAENLLFNKCADEKVFNKAVKMINDFKNYFISHNQVVYENPSPGNKKGGISTLEDKSCGCVQKGGNATIVDCLGYAEQVKKKGLNLLTGPGNDLVSSTVLSAAGAHIVLFTTGRGTPFGCPVPTVKISSNKELFEKKNKWIDFNAGELLLGLTLDEVSEKLLDLVIEVASGKKTKQEINNAREIAIFKDGVTL